MEDKWEGYRQEPDGRWINEEAPRPLPKELPPRARPPLLPVVLTAIVLLGVAAFWVAPRFLDKGVAAPIDAGTPAEQIARLMIESAASGDVLTTAMAPGPTEDEALKNAFIRATMMGVKGDPSTQTVAELVMPTSQRVTALYPEARFIAIVVFLNTVEDEAAEGAS